MYIYIYIYTYMYICIYIYLCIHIFRWRMHSSKTHSHVVFVGESAHLKNDISATAKEKGEEKWVEKKKKRAFRTGATIWIPKGGRAHLEDDVSDFQKKRGKGRGKKRNQKERQVVRTMHVMRTCVCGGGHTFGIKKKGGKGEGRERRGRKKRETR